MQLFYLFLILVFSVCSLATLAPPTLIITGSSQNSHAKLNLLTKYIENADHFANKVENSTNTISILLNNDSELLLEPNKASIDSNVPIKSTLNAIVYISKGFDELNNREWDVLNFFLRTNRKYILVDFDKSNTISKYLPEVARCEITTTATVKEDNIVYICNDQEAYKTIEYISAYDIKLLPNLNPILPTTTSIFAAATKTSRPKIDSTELEEEIQEIVEKTMEKIKKNDDDDDDDDDDEIDRKKKGNRLDCKYRKSCYETGKQGVIEPFAFTNIFDFGKKEEDTDKDDTPDFEDEDLSLTDKKLMCKYRTECYKENNIPLSDRQKEVERSFMSAKLQAPTGKKRTLKDIAKKAVSGVEEREVKAKSRPPSNSLIVEKKLQAIENQLKKKLDCKYRKTCYETGIVPEIEETYFSIPFSGYGFSNSDETDKNDEDDEKSFDEMENLQRKHYCKYRKSCYETGKKPIIEPEIQIESFRDILEVADQVETRKLTLQERCKYRKSCYETGILPELGNDDEHIEKAATKEVSSVVPSTVKDLKMLCKYRKSCYEEVAVAPSSETITTIRRRRIIEKEVRKRRTRRHRRLHRRRTILSRYGMTSRATNEPVEKTQYELRMLEEEREQRKQANKPSKAVKAKTRHIESPKKSKKKELAEEIVEESVAEKIIEPTIEAHVESEDNEEVPEVPEAEEKKTSKKSKSSAKESDDVIEEKQKKVSSRSLKKKKKDVAKIPEEDNVVDEEQEHYEEPQPKIKKSVKTIVKVVEEDEKPENDEDTNKKDQNPEKDLEETAHQPVGDHEDFEKLNRTEKLNCKYRTSCYKTGIVKDVPESDFSLGNIAYIWTGANSDRGESRDDDVDDKDMKMADRKLVCKYRPSCYEKHEIPISEDILKKEERRSETSVPPKQRQQSKKQEDDDDDDDDEDEKPLGAADKKLGCKYRKSCYDSGILPTIKEWNNAPTLVEAIETRNRNMKMEKCKYRKSCYEKAGIYDKSNEEDIVVKEEERKPQLKEPAIQKPSNVDAKHEGRSHKHDQKRNAKKAKKQESEEDDDNEEDEKDQKTAHSKAKKSSEDVARQIDVNDKETEKIREIHLNAEEKHSCKYRKSCYSSIQPKAMKQDHSGSIARRAGSGQKCHIYYLSCREAMGLPPKEKVPIGPNGKRLCRKVKKPN